MFGGRLDGSIVELGLMALDDRLLIEESRVCVARSTRTCGLQVDCKEWVTDSCYARNYFTEIKDDAEQTSMLAISARNVEGMQLACRA